MCLCVEMEGTCPAIDTRIDKVEGAVLSKTHLQQKGKNPYRPLVLSSLISFMHSPHCAIIGGDIIMINYALALPLVSCLDVELSDSVSKRRKRLKSRR